MADSPKLIFYLSEELHDTIWKMLAEPKRNFLYLEIRNKHDHQVTFSLLDLETKKWRWSKVTFEEPWWITLGAASGDILLFTIYTNKDNPDQKSVFAFDVNTQKDLWWKHHFAIASVSERTVTGVESKYGFKELVVDLHTGEPVSHRPMVFDLEQNFIILRPFQYHETSENFVTVKEFVMRKLNFSPVFTVEYCEHNSLIFISVFVGDSDLANYLIVFNSAGEILLKETLGVGLKGIASDTFFIIPGYLIFVKNKSELVSYRIV